MDKLDQLLDKEEQQTGKRVFKRGLELRHGLIDVKGVMDVIKQQQESIVTSGSDVGLPPKANPGK